MRKGTDCFLYLGLSTPSMKRNKLLLLVTILWTGAASGFTQESINWKEEVRILKSELEERHPDLYFRGDPVAFATAMEQVANGAPGNSPFHVAVRLQQAIADLGDPSTRVNYHYMVEPGRILPLRLYWFDDGLRVIRADRDCASLLGKEIRAIGSVPLRVVVDSLSTLLPAGSASRVKSQIPGMLTWAQLLEHFGFADSLQVVITAQGDGGDLETTAIRLPATRGENLRADGDSLPLGFRDNRAFFRARYFPFTGTYYIQYNKCWSREAEKKYGSGVSALFMPSFDEFTDTVLHTLREKKVATLVFDLRFNDGGSAKQGKKLIRRIQRTRAAKEAHVYLLVGRETEAEALTNALQIMEAFDPLVIGEPTGGTPNYFGEVQRFVLQESGLVINCPTRTIAPLENGGHDPLEPQLDRGITFQEYMDGVDPAFEATTPDKHGPAKP